MKSTLSIMLFVAFVFNIKAQVSPAALEGKWTQVEVNGEKNLKCPYQIVFKSDKTYVVYDCREPKDDNGIAESGIWMLNGQILSLNKRVLIGDTYFQPKSRSLNCSVKKVNSTKMVIIYRTAKGEVEEEYKKVN